MQEPVNPIFRLLLCVLYFGAMPCVASGSVDNTFRFHTDLPVLDEEDKLYSNVYYESTKKVKVKAGYRCYKYAGNGDSLLISLNEHATVTFDKGSGTVRIPFTAADRNVTFNNTYHAVLKKTGSIPPGIYKVFIRFSADSLITEKIFTHQVDSNLSATSPLRKELNQTLLPENKAKLLGVDLSKQAGAINGLAKNTTRTVDRAAGKIDRLFRSKGLTSTTEKRNGKEYISLYYTDWFVGRYELNLDESLNKQIDRQKNQLTGPVAALATNELESYRSLLSQVKDLTKQKKEEKQLTGEIGLTGNWGNAQPEYSEQDNNYYELRGRLETKVKDIPVSVEGYYTTQDKHRQIKGSYIRVHYDAEQAKSELMELIGGFKNQFSQTLSKGKGLEQIYGSYLDNLGREKNTLLNDLKKETGVADFNTNTVLDTAGLQQQITASLKDKITDTIAIDSNNADSVSRLRIAQAKAVRTADSANKIYQKALKKYQRLQELEKQGRKYYALLEQYRNTNYFDSTIGYNELKNLDNADAMTYKQLAKKASGLLPEGKVKRFVTGLTSLDIGIFPKEVSKYTLSGQQMKGIDGGYDLGFCEVGGTYGSTEFAGRDGSLDKYTTYSGRAIFKLLKDQKVTLVYYGYTPSRRSLEQDTFFKNVDIALPSFRQPTHIVSAAYEGTIQKNIRINGEVATSFKSGSQLRIRDQLDADHIAWQLHAEGMIPKTTINVEAGYEHGGKDFQNNTLPVNLSGTDLLRLAAKGDFFRSFLTLGVEYNHIEQHSFASTGKNNRWGFEVSTHSKRYPSVSFSYKPYTTFRSYTDTLAIPQRPLVGAVWTGRASYQVKRTGGRSWRFSAIYNKSTSEIDTTSFGSNLLQLNCIYTTKTWSLTGSAGNMDQQMSGSPVTAAPAHLRTTFGMVAGSYPLNKRTNVNGGLDAGIAKFGMSKYGLNAGVQYRLKKAPLTARLTGRYAGYRFSSDEVWKPVYGASVDVLWQLKMKLN